MDSGSAALSALELGRNVLCDIFPKGSLGLRGPLRTRFVQLLIVEGNPSRLDQAEPLQSIIQHSQLLYSQISINLDNDPLYADSCRYRDLGHGCTLFRFASS